MNEQENRFFVNLMTGTIFIIAAILVQVGIVFVGVSMMALSVVIGLGNNRPRQHEKNNNK